MLGHFGFSYVGCTFLVLLLIPNLFWASNLPKGYSSEGENKLLLFLERIGEVMTAACLLVFSDFNIRPWSASSWWLVLTAALLFLYELCWVRYFRSSRELTDFYGSFMGIPVPCAVFPVLASLTMSLYGRVYFLTFASVILGIGHIGIHLQHRRQFL